MNFAIDTIKDFVTGDNITTFITCLISAIIGYKTCLLTINKPQYYKTLEKQLYKVYLPLFQLIEPNLFKEISIEIAQEYISYFNEVKNNHYELIDSELCNLFFIFERSSNSNKVDFETYSHICSRLDFLFENTRKKLKLPVRKFPYKSNKQQYPKNIIDFRYTVMKNIIQVTILILIGIIFSFIFSAISNLVDFVYNLFIS